MPPKHPRRLKEFHNNFITAFFCFTGLETHPIHETVHISCLLEFIGVGTRVEDAKAIIGSSDMRILGCSDLDEAARMVSITRFLFRARVLLHLFHI